MVVVVFEVGDDYTGLEQRRPAVAVEAFVAQPVVERLDKPGLVAIALTTVGCSDSEDTASSGSSSSPTTKEKQRNKRLSTPACPSAS